MVEQLAREKQQRMSRESLKEREQRLQQLQQRTARLRALHHINNMPEHTQATVLPRSNTWDSHPWLLATRRGVIDLRTGSLRPGQPEDHPRTVIPTEWKDLDEPAPRFLQFLHEIFGDRAQAEREELIAFLQRTLGYGITGNVNEHIFLMLYGEEKSDGRDTLVHVLEYVLGKMVGVVPHNVLIPNGHPATPEMTRDLLMSLQGKRIARIDENSEESRFISTEIKRLTEGGAIVARQRYSREYSFLPTHLLLLFTSRWPEADPIDGAFWERLCPLSFNIRFVDAPVRPNERKSDPRLCTALEAEASGILAWLVRGTLEWMRFGLAIPESVLKARRGHGRSESPIQDFVRQCCHLEAEAHTPTNQLYKLYKRWANENKIEPVSNKQFTYEIKQVSGVAVLQRKRGSIYTGIHPVQEASSTD